MWVWPCGSCVSVSVCPRRSRTPVEGVSEQACGPGLFCVWGWHDYLAGCMYDSVLWLCAVHHVLTYLCLSLEHLREQALCREKTWGLPIGHSPK